MRNKPNTMNDTFNKAKKIAQDKKNVSFRVESSKKAEILAWSVAGELGIKAPSMYGRKRGRKRVASFYETDIVNFNYDAETKQCVFTFSENESVIPANLVGRVNKLLPKSVVKAFEKQGDTSQKEMNEIKIICKLFNPYGGGTWYLYEHIEDDVYMGFVTLGDPRCAEMGTVSIIELAESSVFGGVPRIERDTSFESGKHTLEYVYNKVRNGGHV